MQTAAGRLRLAISALLRLTGACRGICGPVEESGKSVGFFREGENATWSATF